MEAHFLILGILIIWMKIMFRGNQTKQKRIVLTISVNEIATAES